MGWRVVSALGSVLKSPIRAALGVVAWCGPRTSSDTHTGERSGIAGARPSAVAPRPSSVGRGTSKLLVRTQTGPSRTLVGKAPHLVQRGTFLTDGEDLYEVLDIADRPNGQGRWILIENVKFEGNAQWFRLSDCEPLAIVDRQKRQLTRAVRG